MDIGSEIRSHGIPAAWSLGAAVVAVSLNFRVHSSVFDIRYSSCCQPRTARTSRTPAGQRQAIRFSSCRSTSEFEVPCSTFDIRCVVSPSLLLFPIPCSRFPEAGAARPLPYLPSLNLFSRAAACASAARPPSSPGQEDSYKNSTFPARPNHRVHICARRLVAAVGLC